MVTHAESEIAMTSPVPAPVPDHAITAVPQEAVDAAVPAFHAAWIPQGLVKALGAALEAAAPAIREAERQRIRQLALRQAAAPLSCQNPIASQALREFAGLIGDAGA